MASASTGVAPLFAEDGVSRRVPELQDALNRLVYHPLAARLARLLQPTCISPNAVSVAGVLLVWGAAWAYTQIGWPQGVVIGLLLHMLWHVTDGADGDLARLTGRSSPTGELVDGVCDYFAHSVLYIALAAMLDDSLGWWAWPLAVGAVASHAAQTNHAETQRRSYLWWAYGIPWLKHARAEGDEVFRSGNWFTLTFGWMARVYLRGADAMTPYAAQVDALAAVAAGDQRRAALVRRLARRASRRSLLLQKAVGPNPRTIILGASMALGSPLYFFLAETLLLNLLLALSVRHHNIVGARLVEKLAAGSPAADG
jgi:phosphatidylglycerophosphate synthase